MIIREIDESLFIDAFQSMGRDKEFSYNGLCALYEYIDEAYEGGEPYKLDVIGLCCAFSEFDSLESLESEYEMTLDEIYEETTVIEVDHGQGTEKSYIVWEF